MGRLVADLVACIEEQSFSFEDESELQSALADLFKAERYRFKREADIGASERIDFLVALGDARWGVEVKVDGSLTAVTRQLHRYADTGRVHALVLVASKIQLMDVPREMCGVPVAVALVLRGLA